MADLLQRISHGRAAEAFPRRDLPDVGALVTLPAWTWALAGIDVGAKDRGPDGARLALPIQIAWQPGPVVVLGEGATLTLTYSMVGLGHSARGETTVRVARTADVGDVLMGGAPTVPVAITAPAVSKASLLRAIEQLIAEGKQAYWQALEKLEPILLSAIRRAVKQVSAEAFEGGTHMVGKALDEADIEAIGNAMLLGESEQNPGAIPRLIDRCATPAGQFAKVDPQRYIVVAITRDAKAAVRKAVGDPHIGPKVRAMAKQLGTQDLDVLLPAYRERYPADNLSVSRANAALALWRRPSASHFSLQETDLPVQSFEDVVAERIDRLRALAGPDAAALPAHASRRRSLQA